MLALGSFLLWTMLSIIVGIYAHRIGRFGAGYGLTAFILSPLVVWLTLLAIGHKARKAPQPYSYPTDLKYARGRGHSTDPTETKS